MNNKPFVVTETEQIQALASPVRSQILDILRQGPDRSVSELAEMTGATGPATHYQVDRLAAAGLVLRAGKRRVGPRSESLFRAVSTKIRIQPKPDSPEYMEALLGLAMTAVRKLEREIGSAHQSARERLESPEVRVVGRTGHVQKEDLPRLYALLEEAAELIQFERRSPADVHLSLRAFAVILGNP